MTNEKKYHFSDFTLENYRSILEVVRKNFEVCAFKSTYSPLGKKAILRHDVDFSPKLCIDMATVEQELSVRATYFVLLRSEWYNILSSEYAKYIFKILELGHDVGLHFDFSHNLPESESELVDFLGAEKRLLESEFGKNISVFSFHNPTATALNFKKLEYAGMLNAYSNFYQENFRYVSDSNGIWKHQSVPQVLSDESTQNVQILIHPEHWTKSVTSPHQRVKNICDDFGSSLWEKYLSLLAKHGRESIDW